MPGIPPADRRGNEQVVVPDESADDGELRV